MDISRRLSALRIALEKIKGSQLTGQEAYRQLQTIASYALEHDDNAVDHAAKPKRKLTMTLKPNWKELDLGLIYRLAKTVENIDLEEVMKNPLAGANALFVVMVEHGLIPVMPEAVARELYDSSENLMGIDKAKANRLAEEILHGAVTQGI